MNPIVTSTDVDRPAAVVFAYATDPTRFPEWQRGVSSGRMESQGPPRVGDACVTVRHIGMADRQVATELVQLDPPKSWRVRGVGGPIRSVVDVKVEPVGAKQSTLTISIDFSGHGIGKLLVPLVVRRQARREMPSNLATLKRVLEGPA